MFSYRSFEACADLDRRVNSILIRAVLVNQKVIVGRPEGRKQRGHCPIRHVENQKEEDDEEEEGIDGDDIVMDMS